MTATSPAARAGQESVPGRGWRMPVPADCPDLAPPAQAAVPATAAPPSYGRGVRPWPLLLLAVPAAGTVWSRWGGVGAMTGVRQVHPLPGILGFLHPATPATLPT